MTTLEEVYESGSALVGFEVVKGKFKSSGAFLKMRGSRKTDVFIVNPYATLGEIFGEADRLVKADRSRKIVKKIGFVELVESNEFLNEPVVDVGGKNIKEVALLLGFVFGDADFVLGKLKKETKLSGKDVGLIKPVLEAMESLHDPNYLKLKVGRKTLANVHLKDVKYDVAGSVATFNVGNLVEFKILFGKQTHVTVRLVKSGKRKELSIPAQQPVAVVAR